MGNCFRIRNKVLGQQAYYFDSVDSTQSQALKMANDSKNEGVIIIAEKQTGGRGRSGRKWISPKGGHLVFNNFTSKI